ncbi:MAG TPA: hypothetical protein VK709_09915 [Candidatus Saccharimonadales bacterium]|nr:hypothetical protein [Candidatus Saccharimonadales bacterium]
MKYSIPILLFIFVCAGIPGRSAATTLEDSAREFAQKIAAALASKENVSYEIRNVSSLQPSEVTRMELAFKAELKDRGVALASGAGPVTIVVTLSENFKNLVWTGEIHLGNAPLVIFLEVNRPSENHAVIASMPVSIHSEKFWEGPERILDAGEITDGTGKSWLVLLLPGGTRILDRQTGVTTATEIISNQNASRDPWGNLNFGKSGNEFGLFLSPHFCSINLETRNLSGCLPGDGSAGNSPASHFLGMIDVAPAGAPVAGKGTEIVMGAPVCGGANQFLATGARDYTQPDSLQLFDLKSGIAAPASAELNFPGPITALHAASETPRAVVKNLSTGNYEAHRLSFTCSQ